MEMAGGEGITEKREMEMDVDEMDSLFEGMVLFTPSQLAEDHEQEQRQDLDHPEPELQDSTQQQKQHQVQEPLDENLFSDLIVQNPLDQPEPEPRPPSATAFSRQTSSTPSPLAEDHEREQKQDLEHPKPESLNLTQQQQQHQVQEPLDENLFSDLTVQTRLDQPEPEPRPPSAATALSRQTSSSYRKKKRATGFRIGYGRDYQSNNNVDSHDNQFRIAYGRDDEINDNTDGHDDNHPASQPSPTLHTSTTTTTAVSLVAKSDSQSHHDQTQQQQQQQQQSINDVQAQFERIKAQIADKLSRARELAASISAARKDSIRRRRKAADDLHLATIKLGDLEKQLEDACEAEDFEAADRINESLAAADKDKKALLTALRDAEAQCNAIDSKMLEVLNCQIAVEEECASLLHRFSEDAMSNADLVFKNSEAQSSEEREKWLSSTEALELNKIELQIEAHLFDDARAVFNTSLDSLIQDDKKEKEFLCNQKDILTDELQKLLALVKEKEKEIAKNDSKIKQVEQRIADMVSGFQEVQSSFNSKYDNLQSHLSQMDIETETLSKKKEEIDKLLAEEEDRGIKLKELARISVGEAKMYQEVAGMRKSLLSSVLKSMEDKVRLAKTEEKLSEDVQILQLEASTTRASLQELSSTKSSIQQSITSLKQRIFFIDKMVPELEAEKKVAAASRNFKEAARLAAEAKSLSVEKEGVQIEMDKAVLDLGKLEEEIKHTVDKLQDIEGLILSKEKEVAMARFQRLLLVAGATKAERSAALELGDIEEANLLLSEANAVDSEAKELQPKYNLKEEEFKDLPEHFISLELVANLGQKKLADLAALSAS
ncbi:myosin-9-like [Durio zibethinus]|uniref:Myosin-9-like n=1 Tax=Durio zibethinus TaxID=66656 RepID=A0A6P5ZL46_DURZI|nr:myosin-9-like [Durio zibethinus]XP_022753279.1 myosin-9-like [Durio zibethinus]XP_022753280.1 myosin-9-like [Durio zibethinus]